MALRRCGALSTSGAVAKVECSVATQPLSAITLAEAGNSLWPMLLIPQILTLDACKRRKKSWWSSAPSASTRSLFTQIASAGSASSPIAIAAPLASAWVSNQVRDPRYRGYARRGMCRQQAAHNIAPSIWDIGQKEVLQNHPVLARTWATAIRCSRSPTIETHSLRLAASR